MEYLLFLVLIVITTCCCSQPTLLWTQQSRSWTRIRGIEGHPDGWVPPNSGNKQYVQSESVQNKLRYSIGFDSDRGDIFWTNKLTGTIHKQHANATFAQSLDGIETIYRDDQSNISAIAVDYVTGNVYYADAGKQHVGVAHSRDGEDNIFRIMFSELDGVPSGICLDPSAGFLFWSEAGNRASIQRSDLAGRGRKLLLVENIAEPIGMTVDAEMQRLFWVDRVKGTVEACDYDSKNRATLVTNGNMRSFLTVAVFEDYLFVSTENRLKIDVYSRLNGSLLREHDVDAVPYHLVIANQRPEHPPHECNALGCDDICLSTSNTTGTCICRQGYYLNMDRTSCLQGDNPQYLHSIGHSILHTSASLSQQQPHILNLTYTPLVTQMDRIQAIGYSSTAHTLHFSDTLRDVIYRTVTSPGSDVSELTVQTGHVVGIAIDWMTHKVYWADSELGHIMVSQLRGHYHSIIIEGLQQPGPLVLDLRNKALYWSSVEGSNSVIYGAMLDGSDVRVLKNVSSVNISGLAFDVYANRLYWTDISSTSIETLDLSTGGSSVVTVAPSSSIYDVTVYQDYVTWTEHGRELQFAYTSSGDSLEHINKVGVMPPRVSSNVTYDVVAFGSYLQPAIHSVCNDNNGGCQHHCFPTPEGARCGCAIGYRKDVDNTSCISDALSHHFLLYTDPYHKQLYQHPLFATEPTDVRPQGIPVPTMNFPVSVDFDLVNQWVYWIDREAGEIKSDNVNGGNNRLLLQVNAGSRPVRLALDALSKYLFYADASRKAIFRMTLPDGDHHMEILAGLGNVYDIAVDPHDRTVYISEGDAIITCDLDGNAERTITTGLVGPTFISLSSEDKQLYIAEQGAGTISVLQLNDTSPSRHLLFTDSRLQINAIAATTSDVYFTAWNRKGVYRLSQNGNESATVVRPIYARIYDLKVYEMIIPVPVTSGEPATTYIIVGAILAVILLLALLLAVLLALRQRRQKRTRPPGSPTSSDMLEEPNGSDDLSFTNEGIRDGGPPATRETRAPDDEEIGLGASSMETLTQLSNVDGSNGLTTPPIIPPEPEVKAAPLTNVRLVNTIGKGRFKKRKLKSPPDPMQKPPGPETPADDPSFELRTTSNVATVIHKLTRRLRNGISTLSWGGDPDRSSTTPQTPEVVPDVAVVEPAENNPRAAKQPGPPVHQVHNMPRGYAPASHNRPREVRTTWGKAKSQAVLQKNADNGQKFGQQI